MPLLAEQHPAPSVVEASSTSRESPQMPQIIAALFDDRGTARRALQALMESGLTADRIAVIGDTDGRNVPSLGGTGEISARDDGHAALHDLPLPDEDLALFARGLAQGHVLVSA